MASTADSIPDLFERYGPAYKWCATITSVLGGMTVILASSTVNVAFPDIMGAFGIARDQAQLMSTGYFGAMTIGMLINPWLVNNFGERFTFLVALALFLTGSAMSGLAANAEILTIGRVMQGTAAGAVQPLAMAITFSVWPADRKGLSMGMFSMGMVLAPTMGPTMGGFAIEFFNWRYVFLLTLPTAGLAFVMGILFMPSRRWPGRIPVFDFTGLGLSTTALAAALLSFSYGQRLGWESTSILSGFLLASICAAAFVFQQLHSPHPLVDMRLFANARYSAATLIAFFTGCAFLSSTFLLPLFVQQIQGYSPLHAGLLMIPGGLSLLIWFPISGRLTDAVPAHYLIYVGLISFGAAFVLLSGADTATSFWSLVFYTILIRIGTAFIRPVTNTEALKSLPEHLVYHASGTLNFIRMLGAALGTNILVVFLELRVPFHGNALIGTQVAEDQASGAFLSGISRLLSRGGLDPWTQESGALHYLGDVIMKQANMFGFQDTFLVLGLFAFCGLVPALYMALLERRRRRQPADAE